MLERVVDAERRVEDVAILRDAGVLQVVVADAGSRAAAASRRCACSTRRPARPGVWPSVGDGDASAQPNASCTSCTERISVTRVWLDVAHAMLHRAEAGPVRQLGGNHLLLQELAAVGAVARQHRLVGRWRRNQELAVALDVEDVERHRMDVRRRQLAEGQARRIGEELCDQAGLLLRRKRRAARSGSSAANRGSSCDAAADPLVGHGGNRVGVADVGEPGRQAGGRRWRSRHSPKGTACAAPSRRRTSGRAAAARPASAVASLRRNSGLAMPARLRKNSLAFIFSCWK